MHNMHFEWQYCFSAANNVGRTKTTTFYYTRSRKIYRYITHIVEENVNIFKSYLENQELLLPNFQFQWNYIEN